MDQHQVISLGDGYPTLADLNSLKSPDGVSLLDSFPVAWGVHARLPVVLDTSMGIDHPAAHGLDTFRQALREPEMDLG